MPDSFKPIDSSDAPPPTPVILVVDDTESNRDMVVKTLIEAGYRALSADGGGHALNIASAQKLDLIILDVLMPRMDGYTVCQQLRRRPQTKKTPVLMCTAKGFKEDVVAAIKAGANDYIVKPFDKATILAKVKKLAGEPPPPPPPPPAPPPKKEFKKPEEKPPPADPPAPAAK